MTVPQHFRLASCSPSVCLLLLLLSAVFHMASPVRLHGEEGQQQTWSGSEVRRGVGGVGGQSSPSPSPSPSPAKARQAQRRYRSLFHQAAKEYWAWRAGEDDSQRAIGSVFHLLDRLRMLEPDGETDGDVNLGGLETLPDCRELLIRKHTAEVERVMRLWRALVQQMRGQVSRVEDALAECWQLHRSDPARGRRPLHRPPPPSPSPQLPPVLTDQISARGGSSPQQSPHVVVGLRSPSADHTPPSRLGQFVGQLEAEEGGGDAGVGFPRPHAQEGSASVSAPASATGTPQTGLGGGGLATTRSVGPAEYLQWLGDMSSMLVHEQWRKEELLSRVAFGPETAAAQGRAQVQAHWSSRSADSFLDQSVVDAAISSAQVTPPPRNR